MSLLAPPLFDVSKRRRRHELPYERPGLTSRATPAFQVSTRAAQEHTPQAEPTPEWVRLVVQRLKHLANLQAGWAGTGSQRIDLHVLVRAFAIIVDVTPKDVRYIPDIVPTLPGGVQLEIGRAHV